MVKINSDLLPVKAHYFCFMAAMGPVLPFLPVIGKQLGISEVAIGLIMSVIPILFFFIKPVFGFVLDYFQSQRRIVFITLVISTTLFFALLQFVPTSENFNQQLVCRSISSCVNESYSIEANGYCYMSEVGQSQHSRVLLINNVFCSVDKLNCSSITVVNIYCVPLTQEQKLYSSLPFWVFVVLLSAASTGYNVANSVSDAICFDVLGDGNEKKYGQQRVWGTVGFGLSALLGGYCVDWWSGANTIKNYSPAFFVAIVFTSLDLLCCFKVKLPVLPKSPNILKHVTDMVKTPSIATFLLFAAFAGICESFIIFFLFWYLEDLALTTGMMKNIKFLQGATVAAETLIGEVVFFPLSGRLIKTLGYRHCLSLCFLAYGLRLGLLSHITNPWWVLPVELLQGPSYALSYTTVVAYASAISPPGTSATMQGIAAGVDDGFGFSVGSLIGGFLYKALGGSLAFKVFSVFALVCSISHWLLCILFFQDTPIPNTTVNLQSEEKCNIYNLPKEAAELVVTAS